MLLFVVVVVVVVVVQVVPDISTYKSTFRFNIKESKKNSCLFGSSCCVKIKVLHFFKMLRNT
jgi:hypothetical protein